MQAPAVTGTARSVRASAIAPPPPAVRRNPAAAWPNQEGSRAGSRHGHAPNPPSMPSTTGGHAGQQHSSVAARRMAQVPERPPAGAGAGARQQGASSATGVSVTWLGTSSGSPTGHRNVSCTVVEMGGATFLVDCGEGTHRQLQEADVDLAQVQGIFITHLHGDHCFGLATTLRLIDAAKVQAAAAAAAAAEASAAEPGTSASAEQFSDGATRGSSSRQGSSSGERSLGQGSPVVPEVRVYGPPGLAQLVRVSLSLTGEALQLGTRVLVTELVLDSRDKQDEQAAGQEEAGSSGAGEAADGMPGLPMHAWGQGSGAQWDSHVLSVNSDAAAAAHSSSSSDGGGGGADEGAGVSNARLPSRSLFSDAGLKAAAERLQEQLQMMPVIWRPPRPRTPDSPRPQTGQTAQQLKEKEQQQQWWQHTAEYAGYNYVAAFGQYWELACAGKRVRVRAAQLQHRVPCWGYVFEELPPTPAAAAAGQAAQDAGARHAGGAAARGRGRKVVILGDTIVSAPIAPLAHGCDIISHEATFMQGMEAKCRISQHSTAYIAGAFAHCIQAKHLVLTHFSGRYTPTGPPPSGRGGKPGAWRERPADADAEAAEQDRAISRLMQEARRYYDGPISAAHDFFRFDVQQPVASRAMGPGGGRGRR